MPRGVPLVPANRLARPPERRTKRIGVGRHQSHGKVNLVLLRPYKKGLIMHQVYYADEVRAYEDVDLGPDQRFSEGDRHDSALRSRYLEA